MAEAEGLLAGVRVIELSHVMAAPTCGMHLADMGADVIKVERLPEGDNVRASAPFVDGESAPFAMMNRNKRGVALNLREADGVAALRKLMEGADVFIENYRTGAMEHYGVGYAQMVESCPRLIYCSVSGFGSTGPYADKGGFDLVAQGMSGLMSITGEGPGRPPVKVGAPVTDITAGTLAALGIVGALYARERTGKGQFVDTSLFEAGIMHTYWQSAIYLNSGDVPQAMGSAHPLMAPYQAFETKDGWINLGSANQRLWERLAELLGAPELASDARFANGNDRITNLSALVETLTPLFQKKTTAEWQDALDDAGIPAGPVYDIAQMSEDAQTAARQMVRDIETAQGALTRVLGHPIKYSSTETPIRKRAPQLGEHTAEVLAEAGYSASEIETLEESGITVAVGAAAE